LLRRAKPKLAASNAGSILQFKIWLKGVSPMIWRRVEVTEATTLRELHGIFQIVMGWEGVHLFTFHLHGAEYGSLDGKSADIPLRELGLKAGGRFDYEYDFNYSVAT